MRVGAQEREYSSSDLLQSCGSAWILASSSLFSLCFFERILSEKRNAMPKVKFIDQKSIQYVHTF